MLPFSSPMANIRLLEKSEHPTLEIQGTTNSSDASVGANATAVAASESLKSATAVHLVRFPSRGCHILTCFHGFALAAPVVARWSEDYSTVLSRDAVAKTFPSAAHAPSQIIRACDLSTAIGTYPTYEATCQGPSLRGFFRNEGIRYGPDPSLLNRRQDLSRETVRTSWSSGLKAMRVTVRV
jgi:hypothetical protein